MRKHKQAGKSSPPTARSAPGPSAPVRSVTRAPGTPQRGAVLGGADAALGVLATEDTHGASEASQWLEGTGGDEVEVRMRSVQGKLVLVLVIPGPRLGNVKLGLSCPGKCTACQQRCTALPTEGGRWGPPHGAGLRPPEEGPPAERAWAGARPQTYAQGRSCFRVSDSLTNVKICKYRTFFLQPLRQMETRLLA